MAGKTKSKTSSSIAALTPKSIVVNIDGQDVTVAMDKFENQMLNFMLIGAVRAMYMRTMKEYTELEKTATPLELKQITDAAKQLVEMSTGAYEGPVVMPSEKMAERTEAPTDIAFDGLTKVPEIKQPNDPNRTEEEGGASEAVDSGGS